MKNCINMFRPQASLFTESSLLLLKIQDYFLLDESIRDTY